MPLINSKEIPQNKAQRAGQTSLDQEQRNTGQRQFKAQRDKPETRYVSKN